MPREVRRAPSSKRPAGAVASLRSRARRVSSKVTKHEPEMVHASEPVKAHEIRVLNPDEKRALIHAHSRRQALRPHAMSFAYYAAITAAFLLVVAGWWFSLGWNLHLGEQSFSDDPLVQTFQQTGQALAQSGQTSLASKADDVKYQTGLMIDSFQQVALQQALAEQVGQAHATSTQKMK